MTFRPPDWLPGALAAQDAYQGDFPPMTPVPAKSFEDYLREATDRPVPPPPQNDTLPLQARAGAAEGLAGYLRHYDDPMARMTGAYDPEERKMQISALARGSERVPKPTDAAGRYTRAVMGAVANPGNYWGVSPGAGLLWAGATGGMAETAGHAFEGTKAEPYARMAGGLTPMAIERAVMVPQSREALLAAGRAAGNAAMRGGRALGETFEDIYQALPQGVGIGPTRGTVIPQPTRLQSGETSAAMGRLAEPPSTLFDYSKIHDVPDVPQVDLPRYVPPRGVSARVQDVTTNKTVERRMLELMKEGRGINAETFYYNEPLRQAFIGELGKKKGQEGFARYMDYVAGSSPRSDVESNARNASYYYMLEKQGLPVPPQGGVNPQPYGHMAQNLHRLNAEKIRSGEYFDPFTNPKPLSFSQNLQGNFAPVTVDAHAFKLPGMLSEDPRFLATSIKLEKGEPSVYPSRMHASGELPMSEAVQRPVYWSSKPNRNEYAAMEQYYKRLAEEVGMAPGQAQAAAWAGGGKITGLGSVPGDPFMRAVENRAIRTAAERGITPAEALSQMMRGKAPLLTMGGAAAMGALAAQDGGSHDRTQPRQ